MQTERKLQAADCRLFKYISCYFHHRVLTVNRVIQAPLSLDITQVRLNNDPDTLFTVSSQ